MGRLTVLKQIAQDLASEFGPDCEVVIHDLKTNDPEHSIVYIVNGHVTGRNIGDGPSDAVFDVIRQKNKKSGEPADHPGYLMKTSDGKILKCSTSYIRDDDGSLHYVFGINYDITKLTMIESALHNLVTPQNKEEKPKQITHNVNDLLNRLIEESVALVGKPVALMNKEDKVTAIQFLNDSGAFLITKSGDKVANYFGISKYTLYSYIDVNK
ncbi:transcriptional regulator [Ruminococcus sp. 5_1_39BFAA]|uniref:helix-turn-helix transcriptional regulator n=1 Tax=Ruminococcus sp. 5_1_39BFAA TaxID=457412 RepID=UPI0035671345